MRNVTKRPVLRNLKCFWKEWRFKSHTKSVVNNELPDDLSNKTDCEGNSNCDWDPVSPLIIWIYLMVPCQLAPEMCKLISKRLKLTPKLFLLGRNRRLCFQNGGSLENPILSWTRRNKHRFQHCGFHCRLLIVYREMLPKNVFQPITLLYL